MNKLENKENCHNINNASTKSHLLGYDAKAELKKLEIQTTLEHCEDKSHRDSSICSSTNETKNSASEVIMFLRDV